MIIPFFALPKVGHSIRRWLLVVLAIAFGLTPVLAGAECLKGDCQGGQGIYQWPSGARYQGQFKNGQRHGLGRYTHSDGSVYTGNYDMGKRHGQGTLVWSTGKKYSGAWNQGFQHGRGEKTWPDGRIEVGLFRGDRFMGPQGGVVARKEAPTVTKDTSIPATKPGKHPLIPPEKKADSPPVTNLLPVVPKVEVTSEPIKGSRHRPKSSVDSKGKGVESMSPVDKSKDNSGQDGHPAKPPGLKKEGGNTIDPLINANLQDVPVVRPELPQPQPKSKPRSVVSPEQEKAELAASAQKTGQALWEEVSGNAAVLVGRMGLKSVRKPDPTPVGKPEVVMAGKPESVLPVKPEAILVEKIVPVPEAKKTEPVPVVKPELVSVQVAKPEPIPVAEPEPMPVEKLVSASMERPQPMPLRRPLPPARPEPIPMAKPVPVQMAKPEPAPLPRRSLALVAKSEPVLVALESVPKTQTEPLAVAKADLPVVAKVDPPVVAKVDPPVATRVEPLPPSKEETNREVVWELEKESNDNAESDQGTMTPKLGKLGLLATIKMLEPELISGTFGSLKTAADADSLVFTLPLEGTVSIPTPTPKRRPATVALSTKEGSGDAKSRKAKHESGDSVHLRAAKEVSLASELLVDGEDEKVFGVEMFGLENSGTEVASNDFQDLPFPLDGAENDNIELNQLLLDGWNQNEKGQYNRAIYSFTCALALSSGNPEAHHGRGMALLKLGSPDRAIRDFDAALEADPSRFEILLARGITLRELEEYKASLRDLGLALVRPETGPEPFVERAITFMAMERFDEALADLAQALAKEPKMERAHYVKGLVLAKSGRSDDAVESFNTAIAQNPDQAQYYFERANAISDSGQISQAIGDYNKAIALMGHDADYYFARGYAHQSLNNVALMCQDLKSACEMGDLEGCDVAKKECH